MRFSVNFYALLYRLPLLYFEENTSLPLDRLTKEMIILLDDLEERSLYSGAEAAATVFNPKEQPRRYRTMAKKIWSLANERLDSDLNSWPDNCEINESGYPVVDHSHKKAKIVLLPGERSPRWQGNTLLTALKSEELKFLYVHRITKTLSDFACEKIDQMSDPEDELELIDKNVDQEAHATSPASNLTFSLCITTPDGVHHKTTGELASTALNASPLLQIPPGGSSQIPVLQLGARSKDTCKKSDSSPIFRFVPNHLFAGISMIMTLVFLSLVPRMLSPEQGMPESESRNKASTFQPTESELEMDYRMFLEQLEPFDPQHIEPPEYHIVKYWKADEKPVYLVYHPPMILGSRFQNRMVHGSLINDN